ncbi:unnamed protein product [Prorocentrum cordatum]|uniref:EF-hand domain-containing protein n=1 Tax=Prorocentrum cordatum TaxID=2364126 RepID=A0ABN9TTI4_9DINO|nr:unnamed protein product [Polarella glacialis]
MVKRCGRLRSGAEGSCFQQSFVAHLIEKGRRASSINYLQHEEQLRHAYTSQWRPARPADLITAVIVDHAIQISTHDAELERVCMKSKLRTLIPILNRMFREFDFTRSGHISLADLDLSKIDIALPTEVISVLKSHKLEDFFNLLDADSSGHITQSEWVDGMCCLVLDEVPIENVQMLQMLCKQSADLDALKRALLRGELPAEALDASPRT